MSVAAGFVIFRRNCDRVIEFLLLQASYEPYHWTPPKGHVEKKDSNNLEAAIRETEEESGLKSSDYKFIEDSQQTLKYNVPPNNREKTVVYWLAELTNNDAKIVLSNEHKDFKWVNLQNAFDLIPYPDMRSMLENMHGFLLTKYY